MDIFLLIFKAFIFTTVIQPDIFDVNSNGGRCHLRLINVLKNPYARFELISSCADQFNSWCSPMCV